MFLLAKPTLSPGWIDVGTGEPTIIRDSLFEVFGNTSYIFDGSTWEYPYSAGYPDLIKLLEDQHQAPIIITNGAKQGLSALFYALKVHGFKNLVLSKPYWALLPLLAQLHSLEINEFYRDISGKTAELKVLPNNPDGNYYDYSPSPFQFDGEIVPIIHDAAYYSHSYLPFEHKLRAIGDYQVFSCSKLLGLPGLRVGYIVCHSLEFREAILEYLEQTTMGVSNISQGIALNYLTQLKFRPEEKGRFEGLCQAKLQESRRIISEIDPEVLEISEIRNGMFGWFKKGPRLNLEAAMVNMSDGGPFGDPDFVRINLAARPDDLKEVVKRLNAK